MLSQKVLTSLGKFNMNSEIPPHTYRIFEKFNTVKKTKCCEDTEKLECSSDTTSWNAVVTLHNLKPTLCDDKAFILLTTSLL